MRCRLVVIAFVLLVLNAATLYAAPAAPIKLELSQPDGTEFTAVPRGDEFANWIETSEGHTIIKVGDTWFYAEIDGAGELIPTPYEVGSLTPAQKQQLPLHVSPVPNPEAFAPVKIRKIPRGETTGDSGRSPTRAISHTQYVLIILVNYNNISFTYSDASFQSLIYGAGNSVRDFYLDNSYSGFTITPATETYGTHNDGIVHVSQPKAHPNQGNNSTTSRAEAREIVSLTDSFIDYSAYDSNGDGTVSSDELSIVIILAGYETGYGGAGVASTPNVWGHAFQFSSSLTLDGVSLAPYTMFGEAHATLPGSTNKHQATIGIMSHELGHLMLGLPDMYDTNGGSNGIGDWGLMGSGSWTYTGTWPGDSPAHLSAWSKVATNFTDPVDIDVNQNGVSLAKADANQVAKRIWLGKYKSLPLDEYFLVENR